MKTEVTFHFTDNGRVFIDINGKPAPENLYQRLFGRLDSDCLSPDGASSLDCLKAMAK